MGLKRDAVMRVGVVGMVGVMLVWPAMFNGYPLVYPDSMSYVEAGPMAARGLWGGFPVDYVARGIWYSLVMLVVTWGRTAWPMVFLQSLLMAGVMWVVVRGLVPRWKVGAYVGVSAVLAAVTGVGWFCSYLMPDVLGPVLYLSLFVLVFLREGLSRVERWGLAVLACWCVMSHSSHLLMAGGLCVLLPMVVWLQHGGWRAVRVAAAWVVGITCAAVVLEVGLHWRLYGHPMVNAKRPPFLLARVIADGPGRLYLAAHPGEWPLAARFPVEKLPGDVGDFLWADIGVWMSSTPQEQDALLRSEMPIVRGTLRAYPREELAVSARHFRDQLVSFGLYDFPADDWTRDQFAKVLPADRERYLASRQDHEGLEVEFFSRVQEWSVMVSMGLIVVVGVLLRRRWTRALVGLAAVVLVVVPLNAAITGVLSNVEHRYQGRVIWMLPMLALVMVVVWGMGRIQSSEFRIQNGQG